MPNPYLDFVTSLADSLSQASQIPLGTAEAGRRCFPAKDAPLALIFSPHPDDEVIIGALPLRLLREAGWRVANVAVTLGSKRERQEERLAELEACCRCVGFELITTAPRGLEGVTLSSKASNPARWEQAVSTIATLLTKQRPAAVFLPHARDWNATHIGVHHLVCEALGRQSDDFYCQVLETEFWGAMDTPNLMVESSTEDLADLLAALSHHVGEVRRNPYHLSLPAWMIDNVRRGGELVGGQGAAAPSFRFATLYRLNRWAHGRLMPITPKMPALPKDRRAAELFT